MIAQIKDSLAAAQADGTAHSEFWRFVGYTCASVVFVRQGWATHDSWAFVGLFVAYLGIIAGSATAIKIMSLLHPPGDS